MRQNHSGSEAGGKRDSHIAFTKMRLAAIPVPQGKRVYVYDEKTEGLCLCVTPAGTRTFYIYKWMDRRPVRIPLGKFPTLSVEQARTACRKLLGKHADGVDVQQARQAARHEQTVAGLWSFWLAYAEQSKRPKSLSEDKRQYNSFLKPWAGRRLSTIKKADVAALHAKIGKENGKYAANRVLSLVRAMFNKAGDMGFNGVNPAVGVKRFPEEKRDRFLGADELPSFFKALLAENATFRDFFLLAILSGARRSNVQSMAWADVDLNAAYWRIPSTKSGVPVVVPLVPAAVAILTARRKITNGSPFVFPSSGRTGHIMDPKAAWCDCLPRPACVTCGSTTSADPLEAGRRWGARACLSSARVWGTRVVRR